MNNKNVRFAVYANNVLGFLLKLFGILAVGYFVALKTDGNLLFGGLVALALLFVWWALEYVAAINTVYWMWTKHDGVFKQANQDVYRLAQKGKMVFIVDNQLHYAVCEIDDHNKIAYVVDYTKVPQ